MAQFDNVGQLLEAQVERMPDKEFLFEESGERVFTYRDFEATISRAADLLLSLGVAKGDRVSLFLTNSVEYLVFYFACFRLGAWAGPVNALLKPAELEFIVNDSQAATVVTQPDLYPKLAASLDKLPVVRHVITVAGGQWSVVSGLLQDECSFNRSLATDHQPLTNVDFPPDPQRSRQVRHPNDL